MGFFEIFRWKKKPGPKQMQELMAGITNLENWPQHVRLFMELHQKATTILNRHGTQKDAGWLNPQQELVHEAGGVCTEIRKYRTPETELLCIIQRVDGKEQVHVKMTRVRGNQLFNRIAKPGGVTQLISNGETKASLRKAVKEMEPHEVEIRRGTRTVRHRYE